MQKLHIHIGDDLSCIHNNKAVIIAKGANNACLDFFDGTDLQELLKIL